MARIDRVRENYEDVTERLFSDKAAFEDYLNFAGKFFKLPSAQSMTIYGTNPKAVMVADFDTWKKFNRHVKRGTNSIAVLDNGGLKHYFDISQTNGSKTPYQWTLGKDTANALIDEVYEQSGMRFKSFSGCVNYLGAEQAQETAENVMNTLNVSKENRAAFEKSYVSMTQYLIAARCELGSSFKYNGKLDLTALDMLHSKAEKERLCEFVQLAGKSVLLSLEKSINNIVMQERTVDYGRSKADMVRGGQEVLSRNQGGERQNVQARPADIRVSGANGTRSDGGGTGADERADRTVGREVAEADGGNAPRTDTVTSRAAIVGFDTPTGGQGSVGAAAEVQDAVREEIPAPDRVQRVESVGEHVRSDSGQRDNGNGSAGSHRINENGANQGATYSTENNEQTAEENSPAVSLSAIAKDILALDTAVKDSGSDVFVEDYLEKHTTNTHTHIVNMLTSHNYEPLRDYLDSVFREAYENRELLAEGTKAQNILADIQKAINPLENKPTAVEIFKTKTAEMFNPVDGQTATDIEGIVRDYVQGVLEDNFIDAEIVDLAVTGSRSRGLESGGSDIDVVVEYSSDFREDAMFNLLHEELFDIGGIKVDINPIRKEETGTLADYLENAEKTIMENHERKAEVARSEDKANSIEGKSSIHFGLLGNGITCYDTSRTVDSDYPTVAHISNEGNIKYYSDDLSADDKRLIEEQAAQQKRDFTDNWNKLPIDTRYSRIRDKADGLSKPQWDIFFADKVALGMEEMVEKYERALIYGDGEFPKAERTVTAYRVGDFYEMFNEDAQAAADLLNLARTKRNGVPMAGFPAHVYEDYRRKFAMNGYYLKIGDEREIGNILNPAKNVKVPAAEPSRIKDEDTIFDWRKYAAVGAHSSFERVVREKNTAVDTSVKISLSPKAEDLSDYALEIGIKPCTENNQLYFAIEYGLRNEKTEEIAEVGAYFVDTDGVMIAGHSGHLPDYDTFRTMVEGKVAKAVDKIRKNARERSPEEIYKGLSDIDRTFFDENAYADILYIEGLVKNARANKPAEQIRLEDREKMYAEQFGTTPDEFRALIRYREAELAKQTVTVSPDDLAVGDYVRGYGAVWKITNIDGDFSIALENTDKSDIRAVQSIIGHWKENFVKQGFEYVSPAEVQHIAAIPSEAVVEVDNNEEFEEIPDEPTNDYTYGEQLSLFGEPMHEVEAPEKTIIGGIDVEEALKRELIQHGTGFVDGKFGVEQFYLEHKGDTKGFAKYLSDAYGIGGHSGEGKINGVDHNMFGVRGIIMRIALDNGEETRVSWNWNKVANRIATLIDKQEYITQREIDERIKHYQREYSLGAESLYYEKAKSVLDHYGLLPEQTKIETLTVTDAQELEKGDKIRYEGKEWTVGGVGDHFISLKNSEGEQRNFYNAPDVKWYDTLNANGFEFIAASEVIITDLDRAKELINDFCEREYDSTGDFSDLTRVAIAYTEDEETGLPIQIYADLENFRIITQFNNVTVKVDEYTSLAEMNEIALPELNFDELIIDAITYKEPDFSVTQEYIFDNERSRATTKDFALSTGATVSEISEKALKSGLYGVRVETWESRADEIKDFAAAQNAVETHEWGVHQVVTFSNESGADEKYDYRSLSEAVDAANGYASGTKQETYGEFVKYDGAVVLNKENLKIEHTVGEIDVRSIFSEEVLKANGIDVAENKAKTAVEEKHVEKEDVQREQTNEVKAGDRFMYHGNIVTVTDDKGIYPDDIVITCEEKLGSATFAITENVNVERFAREAKRIAHETEKQTVKQEQMKEPHVKTKKAQEMSLELNTLLVKDKYETRNTEIVRNINRNRLEAKIPITRSNALVERLAEATEFGLHYAKSDYDVSLVTDGTTNGTSLRLTAHDNSYVTVDMSALSSEEYRTVEIITAQMAAIIAEYAEKQDNPDIGEKSEDIKNLAQLRRALTVGAEFEITSYILDDVVNQWRRVNYADTTAIYSIRPDAPDDERTTLANHGRGSYLPWEKASDWEFANGICTAYRRGTEHTEENRLFSIKVRPRILTQEREEKPQQTTDNILDKLEAVKDSNGYADLKADVEILLRDKNGDSIVGITSNAWLKKLNEMPADELREYANHYEKGQLDAYRSLNFDEKLNKIAQTANTKIDYTITDENLGVGGAKEKFAANIAAIETLKRIESRNLHLAADMFKAHNATPDEQKILAGYVGWGGLSQAFDPNNKAWAKEYRQLKELLTDEEYAAAKGSTLNAHYTTPTVISAIYKGLQNLGFEGGNILEPAMGVGNFFGAMPEELRKNSNLSGVELDSITGRIAQQLYQNADVQIKGFEKTDFSDNYFDLAVGNVPFGSYPVSDKRYNRENFFIHDYFLAKTLDKLAPGGVAAIITTKGTLDKENPKVREYLAKRADLIGAIRLPNTAFKANAGTEVTTDILFLQKREKMAVELPDWCYIAKDNNGVPVNQYFLDHPEMVLGTMKQGLEFSMYGNPNETACVPIKSADLKEQLEAAVANLKTNNAIRKHSEQRKAEAGVIPATADVRNFTFAEVDGKMYFRENNIMTEAADKNGNALTGKSLERIRALNELRQTFRTILTAQENNCSDAQLETYQKVLNAQYDTFVKKYGYINDRANYQAFGKDDDYNSLCALELVNEETHEVTKSDFFSKRTVKQFTEITQVDTPQEALFVSVDTLGKLDIPYMAELCKKEPDEVIDALKADNLIYLNPKKANPEKPYEGWEEASEYLSGNVRVKLRAAERAAESNPELQRNVDALTAVIPQKLEAGDITARIGVHWVDVEDYQKFLQEYAKAHFVYGEPLRRAYNGEYKIPFKGRDYTKAATEIFGTKRMNSLEIFENLLNNRDVVVKDKKIDPDGREHYEINKKETELAQDKASKMKEAFKRWLWEEPERREKYVERYNELFNCIVGRKYDGSHQTFPGMSPSITLKPHQLDAIARAKFGGNTLLAHCVGAGKSFEMVAATMEKKRLGLINKACVVGPKELVGQMASEWLRLYPQAKILTATEKDFDKDHRQKFIGRCCTGDYDAVIMSYEQFEKIPMSFEYRCDFIQREINTLTSGIDDLKFNGGRNENSGSIKDLERTKKRLEARLEKLIEDNGKTKDTSLNFEQLGFDSLVVDEAHNYKNGLVVTKMQRVAGVQTTPAQKSEDILMKTQYLNENYGERTLLFATGTPVSNSMTELYVMKRYLRPSLLAQAGLQTFDDWASTFGEVVSKAEMKPAGNGYRTKKRFAKFNNLPELMAMYKEFADVRTADMLDLPVPKIKGGKPKTIVAEPNDFQKAYMKVLAERSEKVHSGLVDATQDNMLKITGEARLLGLDVRCLNPEAPNYPDSKVNLLIEKVMEIYTQTTPKRGVQAIFCDIAVHGDNEAEELSESNEQSTKKPKTEKSEDGRFSVYNYIKAELIRRGVPADEICFAGDADTVKKQNEMKAQLRSGTKRIVLSSTSKLGTGANIQNKLVALHNLDIPWKPSDLEQRLGRIVRQGNENDEVGIYNYVTKDTFDAYMMNIIITKQKFISQLNTTTSRSCEDVDDLVLNYSEIQAMAVGDERIKEKIELDMDVSRLKMLESEHYNAQYRLDDTIADAQKLMKNFTHNIAAAKDDLAFAQENKYASEDFKVEIGGKVYTDRKEAGTALREAAVEFMANDNGVVRQPIGTFCGFELSVGKSHGSFGGATAEIVIRHGVSYTTEMDLTGDIGNATRLENLFGGGIEKKIASLEERAERTSADLQAALANKGKPFEHAEELAQKSARLEQLNLELEVGKVDEVIIADDEPEQNGTDRNEKHHDKDAPDNDRDKPTPPRHGGRR